ncbi:hypothetical protein PRIPAC_78455 [Pristionchus pacificus]|nr:hypothetical protein PRIPAC_78455 [Pristionchus pacificus]
MLRKYDSIMPILIMDKFAVKQSESLRKILNNQELPPKAKHVDRIVQGTHQRKSCAFFWSGVITGNLEHHPLVTWKFCHLLHTMIRDGHESVPRESYQSLRRLMGLRDFWKRRQSSSYGFSSAQYCNVVCDRLLFHRKYPQIPGNLVVPNDLLQNLQNAVALNAGTEVLDHMDNLLLLQRTVFDSLEWPYVTGQGQILLAPLTLVIADTWKLYGFLIELLHHLHSVLPGVRLAIHRRRFQEVFRQMKAFLDLASKLQYFPSLPSLPLIPPTFHAIEVITILNQVDEMFLSEEPPSLLMQPD